MKENKDIGIGESEFEKIFREHFRSLVYFAHNIVKDKDTAKDIVHDSFSVLWEKRNDMSAGQNIKSYLFTTVYHKSLNHVRFRKKFTEGNGLELIPDESYDLPDGSVENAELKKKISHAISLLPEKTKIIFIMSRFKNMKYAEIAEKQGISVKTVEAQMSRALRMLRDNLKGFMALIFFIIFFLFRQ